MIAGLTSANGAAASGPTLAAALWVQNILLGTIATAVAVIAVATVGLLMLAGRIDIRRGATVVAGCFILFGAPSIAAGLRSALAASQDAIAPPLPASAPPPTPPPPAPPPVSRAPYDPYAGAAVPTTQ